MLISDEDKVDVSTPFNIGHRVLKKKLVLLSQSTYSEEVANFDPP